MPVFRLAADAGGNQLDRAKAAKSEVRFSWIRLPSLRVAGY